MKSITPEVGRLMQFADYARESKLWPVAGGAVDQCEAFMEAEKLIRRDRSAWRAKQGLRD